MSTLQNIRKLGPLYKVAYAVLTPLMVGFTNVRMRGEENIPAGGFILVSNHLSNMDPLVQAYAFGVRGYEVRFMAKAELFRVPLLGSVLRSWGMIPVERKTGNAVNALQAAEDAVKLGRIVSFFPEGTITKDPAFWPMTFKTGAARLALKSGVPLVVITQWGTQDMMDRNTSVLRPGRTDIQMKVLPPIYPRDFGDSPDDKEAVAALNGALQDAVRTTLGQMRGEEPPAKVWNLEKLQVSKKQWGTFSSWRRVLAKRTGRQDILPGHNR